MTEPWGKILSDISYNDLKEIEKSIKVKHHASQLENIESKVKDLTEEYNHCQQSIEQINRSNENNKATKEKFSSYKLFDLKLTHVLQEKLEDLKIEYANTEREHQAQLTQLEKNYLESIESVKSRIPMCAELERLKAEASVLTLEDAYNTAQIKHVQEKLKTLKESEKTKLNKSIVKFVSRVKAHNENLILKHKCAKIKELLEKKGKLKRKAPLLEETERSSWKEKISNLELKNFLFEKNIKPTLSTETFLNELSANMPPEMSGVKFFDEPIEALNILKPMTTKKENPQNKNVRFDDKTTFKRSAPVKNKQVPKMKILENKIMPPPVVKSSQTVDSKVMTLNATSIFNKPTTSSNVKFLRKPTATITKPSATITKLVKQPSKKQKMDSELILPNTENTSKNAVEDIKQAINATFLNKLNATITKPVERASKKQRINLVAKLPNTENTLKNVSQNQFSFDVQFLRKPTATITKPTATITKPVEQPSKKQKMDSELILPNTENTSKNVAEDIKQAINATFLNKLNATITKPDEQVSKKQKINLVSKLPNTENTLKNVSQNPFSFDVSKDTGDGQFRFEMGLSPIIESANTEESGENFGEMKFFQSFSKDFNMFK